MIQIGVTGGIGSGKSTVCRIFRLLDIPVFEADKEARILQDNDSRIKEDLKGLFGNDIYNANGALNRQKLAEYIFNDKGLLNKVNQIVHPRVNEQYNLWLKKHHEAVYVVYEAAILFESGRYRQMDKTILVTAPVETRIERVVARDKTDKKLIEERIKNQMPDEEKIPMADFILKNDERNLILPLIIEIDKNLRDYGKIC